MSDCMTLNTVTAHMPIESMIGVDLHLNAHWLVFTKLENAPPGEDIRVVGF